MPRPRRTDALYRDLHQALRLLRRSPGFAIAAVLTLALGIGINTITFGAIDALLLRPPAGVGDPAGLYRLELVPKPRPGVDAQPGGGRPVPYSYYAQLRDRTGAFSALAAYSPLRTVTVGSGSGAQRLDALYVSADYFTTLRVRPTAGHFFPPVADRAVANMGVLSAGAWQRDFGGDPGVVGRTLLVDGRAVEVVGVAPRGFRGIDLQRVDLWLTLPVANGALAADMLRARVSWLSMVGRPRPGIGPVQAAARVMASAPPDYLKHDGSAGYHVALIPAGHRYAPGEGPIPAWVLGVTAVVLLAACANVAGLLLARAGRRRRELAVRLALGASRGRVVRQLFTETFVLAVLGAALGILFGKWGGALLPALGVPPLSNPVDLRAAVFTGGTMILAALTTGVVPAFRGSRVDVERELKAGSRRGSMDRSRLRAALTIGEVALSLALLVSAALFAQSFRNARSTRLGFDAAHTVTLDPLFAHGATSPGGRAAIYRAAVERLRKLPGVVAVARASMAPYQGLSFSESVRLSDGPPHPRVSYAVVGPDYFRALGTRLLEGRPFSDRDGPNAPAAAIVDRAFVRAYLAGRDPIGACMQVGSGPACTRIVGVVDNVRSFGIVGSTRPQFYLPLAQRPQETGAGTIVLRARGDPGALSEALRHQVQALDPRILYVAVRPERDMVRPLFAAWRTAAAIVTLVALLTLLLSLVGIYGVVAQLAGDRTREVGIRTALGAREAQIRALIVREGAQLVLVGTGIGVLLALAGARLLRSRFFGVSSTQPFAYLAAALIVAAAALLASYLPARRAARVDPVEALRAE